MNDDALLAAFEAVELSLEQFSHRAHVRLAWILLENESFDAALNRLRVGLPRLLAAFGIEDTPSQGYHETTTHAFLQLVDVTRQAYQTEIPAIDSEAFCEAHPQLQSSKVLRLFYSPARRMDPRAKAEFLAPDLAPLPRLPS
jgi:hypothetical protein